MHSYNRPAYKYMVYVVHIYLSVAAADCWNARDMFEKWGYHVNMKFPSLPLGWIWICIMPMCLALIRHVYVSFPFSVHIVRKSRTIYGWIDSTNLNAFGKSGICAVFPSCSNYFTVVCSRHHWRVLWTRRYALGSSIMHKPRSSSVQRNIRPFNIHHAAMQRSLCGFTTKLQLNQIQRTWLLPEQ